MTSDDKIQQNMQDQQGQQGVSEAGERAGSGVVTPDLVAPNPVTSESVTSESVTSEPNISARGSSVAILRDKIEILVTRPLPHLNHGSAKAFAAREAGDSKEIYFALICEKHLVPRSGVAEKFSGSLSSGMVRLISYGAAYWPPANAERYIFVYQNNIGKPLMTSLSQGGLGWKVEKTMAIFVKPLLSTLIDLRNADAVHGCINPMNIFDGGGGEIERVILGECLSAPPSYNQPAVFEPIERAMADPIGRGKGTGADDLYAFGVALTMVLRSKDPLAGMSDEEIIHQKVELGSYAALTGKDRFTGAILELLRGLLYDDWRQRWTLDEVMSWIDGQRLSPKQSAKKPKATRPVHFNDERYFRPALLAMDLAKSESEAVQMIDNGSLEQWIERSLEDSLTKNRLDDALETARENGRGAGYNDRLLCRVSMALDPEAPIRFKGIEVQPEGVPYALVEAVLHKKDIVPYVELINQQLVMTWIGLHNDPNVDVGGLITRFDSCRAFLRQNTVGYGLERCLYYLNSECPCLSPILDGYYVRSPEDYLRALNDIADKPKRPDMFIDRHVAAFLSVKDKRNIDPYFIELNSSEYHKRVLAYIKVMATIQKRSRMDKLPGLALWVAETLDPVYERFHDRELREQIKERVDKTAKTGDLVKIATILDHHDTWQKDFHGFRRAMEEYIALEQEQIELEHKMKKPETFGNDTGREVAAIVSGMLAGIIILTFAFMHLTQMPMF